MRSQVSLLISEGHADAPDYPVALVWEEHQLAVERENQRIATEATFYKLAVGTAVAAFSKDGGKAANKQFRDRIVELVGETAVGMREDDAKRRRTPSKG